MVKFLLKPVIRDIGGNVVSLPPIDINLLKNVLKGVKISTKEKKRYTRKNTCFITFFLIQ